MSDDEKKVPEHPPLALIEAHENERGEFEVDVHGPSCERTREVHQAFLDGREPPHPSELPACKGPAKVTNEAYRRGWDAINWGSGSKKTVGQA